MLWKKRDQPGNPTFKSRVDDFWNWFSGESERLHGAIESERFESIRDEVSGQVAQLWPHLAWVFGPETADKGGHSFTVSGEGILARQFLADYWLSCAPELEHWTFYSSRQPGEVHPEMCIEMKEARFDFAGLWITPELDEESETVNITAWHPMFEKVDEGMKDTALFIMLDEVLGEYGTDQWIGTIDKADNKLDGAFPAMELRDFLHDLEVEKGWKKLPPTESYSTYQLNQPDDSSLRSDTIGGSTCHMRLVGAYLDAGGPIDEDEIEDSGAEFVFISYPTEIAPQGSEVEFRGRVEDAITEVLDEEKSGRVIGGATGMIHCYIDLILFDGDNSLRSLTELLRSEGFPPGTSIQFFIRGNEGRRVIL